MTSTSVATLRASRARARARPGQRPGVASPRRSGVRRRSASPRRRSAGKPQRPLPATGPGKQSWVLDVPYGTQVDGATWHPVGKTYLYVGRARPAHLAPYSPGPHTLGRFIDNTLNPDRPTPNREPTGALEPRQVKYEAAAFCALARVTHSAACRGRPDLPVTSLALSSALVGRASC